MNTQHRISRRDAIKAVGTTAAAISFVPREILGGPGFVPPSEKVRIVGVGVGGMGSGDTRYLFHEGAEIVALCDVDERALARNAQDFPQAKPYTDYRRMFEVEKDFDAVMVATPDHNHAIISILAMKMGKHVHCQKPLTHSVYEARMMQTVARETGVATQMGNQGQASEAARLIWETIASGAIGDVLEVHAGSNRFPAISPRGVRRPADTPAVPEELDWDLWLGPAPARPYHPTYHPFSWRGWWDFGTGVLGDIGCHNFSAIYKALDLGAPVSIEASSTHHQCPPEIRNETAPTASVVHFDFAAKGDRPAVSATWYDGGIKPRRPEGLEEGREVGNNDGMMYIGDKGAIVDHRIVPERRMKEYGVPPKILPRSPGHHREWIDACKGGPAAGANFDHAGPLTEMVLLGNIAIRTGRKLYWDAENFKITNVPEANNLLHYEYRKGWTL